MLLVDFGYTIREPTPIKVDHTSKMKMMKGPGGLNKTKYIKLKFRYVRGTYEVVEILSIYVKSKDSPANVSTKHLGPFEFHKYT